MTGAIFKETLRRHWTWVLYWGIGLVALALTLALIIPNSEVIQQYAELLEAFPDFLLSMFGGMDIEQLATPEGFMNLELFSWLPFVMGFFAVVAGLSVTSNDEDSGILDIVLSNPVPRWKIIIEKFVVYSIMTVVIAFLLFGGLWLGSQFTEMDMNMEHIFQASMNIIPITIMIMALTILLGALIRRRVFVIGIIAVFIVAGYFLNVVSEVLTGTVKDIVSAFSYYSLYDSADVMFNGWNPQNILILLVISIALIIVSVVFFNRRDVGI